jgi:WD40 repeat protein
LVFSGPSANASIEFSAKVWDFAPDPQPSSLDLGPSVTAFAVSADGRSVAVASAGKLRIIDSTSGITRRSFSLAGTAKVAALSPDADFLVAATDEAEVHLWQSEPPKEIADFKLPDRSAITRLAVSPGATNVIAISSGKITRSGVPVQAHVRQSPFTTEVAAFSAGHDRSGFQTDVCALSADGRYLTAGGRILDPSYRPDGFLGFHVGSGGELVRF